MFTVLNDFNWNTKQETLIIGCFKNLDTKLNGLLENLDEKLNGQLSLLIQEGEIDFNNKSINSIYTLGRLGPKKLVIVGLGEEENFNQDNARDTFGSVFKSLKGNKDTISILIESFTNKSLDVFNISRIFAEAFSMASYEFKGYKTKNNEEKNNFNEIIVYSELECNKVKSSLETGYIFGQATNSARNLVNIPSNLLTPSDIALYAKGLANQYDMSIEILEKDMLNQMGMGAFLAVNQGSSEPAKMIVIKYQGREDWEEVIGLIGKGVTFDTGGYSVKSKEGIVGMKSDMAGAAAVLGTLEIIGRTRPKQNVLVVIPTTDNLIGPNSFKPDDVITSMCGKTIEVLNTDAEGRLVLADAITYAKRQGAQFIIDVGTLTGGVITALGYEMTGAMTNNGKFFKQVLGASYYSGEPIWRLPITEKDKERVRNSRIADLNNSPGGAGHAIMGGAFLGEFAEETPWVHLDIAGTAVAYKPTDLNALGGTGVMVRTLAFLVNEFSTNVFNEESSMSLIN